MGSYPIWILILINLRHLVFGAALVGIFASIPRLTETTGRRTAAAGLLGVSVVIAVLLSPPAAQLQTLGGIPGLLLLVLGGAAAAAARLKPGIGLFFPVFAFASYLAGFVTLLLTGRPFALVFGECAAAFSRLRAQRGKMRSQRAKSFQQLSPKRCRKSVSATFRICMTGWALS